MFKINNKWFISHNNYTNDKNYINLLKHELIHYKLHRLCYNYIYSMKIDSYLYNNGYLCKLNTFYRIKKMTIITFISFFVTSLVNIMYDFIYYIYKRTLHLILKPIIDDIIRLLGFILSFKYPKLLPNN